MLDATLYTKSCLQRVDSTMKQDYFLGIDVGNTHTVIGLFDSKSILKTWRISTLPQATCHELAPALSFWLNEVSLNFGHIKRIILSSVVPPANDSWRHLAENYFGLTILNAHEIAEKIININYPRPYEIGTDRLVNAIGAYDKFKRACIVADFGTATTFDCVSEDGEYLGGTIAPGIILSLKALFSGTSKLPLIGLESHIESALGKTTEEAIRAGILYGFSGLTDRIISKLLMEYPKRPLIVATGGLSELIFRFTEKIDCLAPDLTMEGLKTCLEKNTWLERATI